MKNAGTSKKKKTLQCRMEKNLMAKQALVELGFKESNVQTSGGKITDMFDNQDQ